MGVGPPVLPRESPGQVSDAAAMESQQHLLMDRIWVARKRGMGTIVRSGATATGAVYRNGGREILVCLKGFALPMGPLADGVGVDRPWWRVPGRRFTLES